jgi:hypothetical protein
MITLTVPNFWNRKDVKLSRVLPNISDFITRFEKERTAATGLAIADGTYPLQLLTVAIEQNSSVSCLRLSDNTGTSLADACHLLRALHANTSITCLDLSGCDFPDSDYHRSIAQAIHSNRSIIEVDLSGLSILPAECELITEAVVGNPVLEFFTSIPVQDMKRNCVHLTGQREYYTLSLNSLGIGDVGAYVLEWLLRTSYTILVLHLRNNGIGPAGSEVLANCLRWHNTSVREVDLSGNAIGEQGGNSFCMVYPVHISFVVLRSYVHCSSNQLTVVHAPAAGLERLRLPWGWLSGPNCCLNCLKSNFKIFPSGSRVYTIVKSKDREIL